MKPYFQRHQHNKISDLAQEVSDTAQEVGDLAQEVGDIVQEMQISRSLSKYKIAKSANQHKEHFRNFDYAYKALFYAPAAHLRNSYTDIVTLEKSTLVHKPFSVFITKL